MRRRRSQYTLGESPAATAGLYPIRQVTDPAQAGTWRGRRQRLQPLLDQIRSFTVEQAALTASRQQATERVYVLLGQSRKLATVLRTAVREHYGNRSQKVVEFGLQPLRTRPRRTDDNPTSPE